MKLASKQNKKKWHGACRSSAVFRSHIRGTADWLKFLALEWYYAEHALRCEMLSKSQQKAIKLPPK
jgi:hypothetical protein